MMIPRIHTRACGRPPRTRCRCNPLEKLRVERDPAQRSKLLSSLDSRWSEFTASYQQSDVEQLLTTKLGIEAHAVMMLAVGTVSSPPLTTYDVGTARASLMALKAANIDVLDIWFLVSRRPSLLLLREVLQRWLDFLSVYGLREKGECHAGLAQAICHAPHPSARLCAHACIRPWSMHA